MRGRGLGSYTLGDRYVTPDRRLSQSLIQQGSKGGPSNSWQETMGRIAQQLAGAYIGYKDQKNQNAANQAFSKVEPDSFSPTYSPAETQEFMKNATGGMSRGLRGSDIAEERLNAGQFPRMDTPIPTAPPTDDQLMEREGIKGIMDKISRFNGGMSGDPVGSASYDQNGDQALNDGVDLQAQKYRQAMEQGRAETNPPIPGNQMPDFSGLHQINSEANIPRPNPAQQTANLMAGNQTMNEKKPQLEYAMQNLRGLENNPYAQRLLQGLMMNQMDTNAASRLAETQRGYKDADVKSARDFTTSERLAGEKFKQGETTKSNQSAEKVATGKSAFGNEDKLRDEFNKGSGDFLKVRDAFGRIKASAKDPSPAGDLALIFNYMKVLDPGSTVREGEFATAQNSASIPDRIKAKYNQVMRGERLALAQRADFVDRAESLYTQQEKFYKGHEQRYRDLAINYQLNPDRVVQGLNQGFVEDAPPEIIEIPQTGDQEELDELRKWKAGQPK